MNRVVVVLLLLSLSVNVHAFNQEEEDEKLRQWTIQKGIIKVDTPAQAACTEADLNKSPQSPFRKIPVYDQDGSGTCYAYVAAQMIDYYQIKNGTSKGLTNPIAAAWADKYKSSFFKSHSLDSGEAADVIESVRKVGVCSDRETKARLAKLRQAGGGMTEPELMAFMDVMYDNYNGFFRGLLSKKDWDTASSQAQGEILGLTCDRAASLRDQLKRDGLFGMATTDVLGKLFQGCKMEKRNVPSLQTVAFGSNKDLKLALDRSLKKGLPASASLCSVLFNERGFRGLKDADTVFTNRGSKINKTNLCQSSHAAIVAGQVSINGTCHYLIRNSHGAGWKPKAATACACITKTGQYKQLCVHSEAREIFGCWFAEDQALSNFQDVATFK